MSSESTIAVSQALAKSNDNLADAIRGLTNQMQSSQAPATADEIAKILDSTMTQITSGLIVQLEASYRKDHQVEGQVLVEASPVKGVRLCR